MHALRCVCLQVALAMFVTTASAMYVGKGIEKEFEASAERMDRNMDRNIMRANATFAILVSVTVFVVLIAISRK